MVLLEERYINITVEKLARCLKSMQITPLLINLSRDERMPASIKSKMIKVIKIISQDQFVDTFTPHDTYRPQSKSKHQALAKSS